MRHTWQLVQLQLGGLCREATPMTVNFIPNSKMEKLMMIKRGVMALNVHDMCHSEGAVLCAAFSPNGWLFATGAADGYVRVYKLPVIHTR
jgi:WD40 repeat protein